MSKTHQNKTTSSIQSSDPKPGSGNPLLTGILIGLVLGVGLCSSIAIWIARSPSPFTNRALQTMGLMKGNALANSGNSVGEIDSASTPSGSPSISGDSASAVKPSSNTVGAEASTGSASVDPSPASIPSESPKSNLPSNLYVQFGAFSSPEEAQKQIEVVAQLTGQKAHIWPSAAGESGKSLYRVRIGAFAQTSDTAELTQILKSNGISYILVRPVAGETSQ